MSYPENPNSNFPEEICDFPNMQDISPTLRPIVDQYNEAWEINDTDKMAQLKLQYPNLDKSLFNAEKFNVLLDEIKSTQRFFKDDVDAMVQTVAQHTVGIKDDATGAEKKTNTYSAEKIDNMDYVTSSLINQFNHVTEVTLTAAGWTGNTTPYIQTITIPGATTDTEAMVVNALEDGATETVQKAYTKAFGIVVSGTASLGAGTATFKVYKKPVIDIKIGLKGV